MPDPYRDENASLRAENARLQAEIGTRRVAYGKLALPLVAADFVAIILLRPWLNGTSDLKFWAGLFVIIALALVALASATGIRRKRA